jgi:hypothetical protein
MIIATTPPIEIPLERMTRAQKEALREALTQDLDDADSGEQAGPQEWHFELLAERERRLASGEANLMPLKDFLEEMRRTMP